MVSDRGHNDGGAEEKAVKEIAMVRSRITVQVIQQYSDSRGFKMQSLGGGGGKHFKAHHILNCLCTYECVCERERDKNRFVHVYTYIHGGVSVNVDLYKRCH